MKTVNWYQNPAYKNLYAGEVGVLTHGLGSDFELVSEVAPNQSENLDATGWLKYKEEERQPIKIVFPPKYPYASPIVFPLLKNEDGSISNKTHFFGKGNQYGDGTMCLMRKEQWDQRQHGIGWILRRAQKWLSSATSSEGFTKEEIVEEITATTFYHGQVILPKDIPLPENLKSGILNLTRFKPNYYILEQNFIPETPFVIEMGREQFRWFRITKGVMLKDIFSSDINVFISNLATHGISKEHVAGKNLALYIPDDPCPWHFFQFPFNGAQILRLYFISRNVEKELYHRTRDVFDESILKTKKVTIIGLGAIGSEVARSLARNAVGHFNLYDNDSFEIGNSVRHAADLYFIGENKAMVAKQLILRSNPNITVNAYPIDILNDHGTLEQSLASSDLCIVLTADDNVEYMINDLYVPRYDIPFVFARVSAGGLSGAVQVVHHSRTACLRCLSLYEADTLPKPRDNKRYEELGPEYGSCASPAVAGSEIDTKEIAMQVSRISLQLLLEKDKSTYAKRGGDQYYWHGPFGSKDAGPFTWSISQLKQHQSCERCNP